MKKCLVFTVVSALVLPALGVTNAVANVCTPLADVSFTIDGISRLSSAVIQHQFHLLKNKVQRLSNFKTILLRPKCDGPEAATSRCVEFQGLPGFDVNGMPILSETHPIQFDLDLKKTGFDMRLTRPIECVNFVCTATVEVNSLVVDGTITNFVYVSGPTIAPKLKPEFKLVKPATYSLQITIDPSAQDVDHLATTNVTNHIVTLQPGSIEINLRPLSSKESSEAKAHRLADVLREALVSYRAGARDPGFGRHEVQRFEVDYATETQVYI